MRGVRRPSGQLLRWNNQHERWRRNCGQAEKIRRRAHEDLRGDRTARFILVIGDGTRTMRPGSLVAVVAGEMGVQRLTVMVLRLLRVEVHVRQGRGDRSDLDEHDERGGGQPAKHAAIVVNRRVAGT